MKKLFILTAFLPALALAQVDQTAIDRPTGPPEGTVGGGTQSGNGGKASDAGAQRPISVQLGGLSVFAGYDTKIVYRYNPQQMSPDLLDGLTSGIKQQDKSGIWQNTVSAGASAMPIDTDTLVITPLAGISWTASDYLNEKLSKPLNDYATTAYSLLMIQHESGWGFRAGTSYTNVRNNNNDSEDYREFYPNLGAMKTFSLGSDTLGILDVSGGFHITKASSSDLLYRGIHGTGNYEQLNNRDFTVSYTIRHNFHDFVISPCYRFSYKKFTEDDTTNSGRWDIMNILSLKADYALHENIDLSTSYSYSRRNSSNENADDMKTYDLGFNIGFNVRF
jgi:hypothetical protein